jgi:hypothetical protein
MRAAGFRPDARPLVVTAQLAGLAATNLLIGIDDTDNLDSKGTGNLAQRLSLVTQLFERVEPHRQPFLGEAPRPAVQRDALPDGHVGP